PDWPASRLAKLIAAQLGLGGREVVGSVELVVTEKLEDIFETTVAARLGDGVHDRATEFSVLGIEAVSNQPEFLNRVQIGNHASAQVATLADVPAIYKKRVGRFALTVDGNVARIQTSGNRAILLNGFGRGRRHASLQPEQIDVAAPVERQGEHLLGIDHVAELGIFCVYAHGICGSADFLRYRAHIESNVEFELVVHLKNDIVSSKGPESRSGCVDPVVPGGQSKKAVRTIRAGNSLQLEVGVGVGYGDANRGNRALSTVADDAL